MECIKDATLCSNTKRQLMNKTAAEEEKLGISILELPDSFLEEILSRLPVKAIFQCKCVCKAWYELLSDPHFAETYLTRPPFVSILLSEYDSLCNLLELDEEHDYTRIPKKPTNFREKFNLPRAPNDKLELIGSCNGLLCLLHVRNDDDDEYEFDLYISNPILGEFVKIPKPKCENRNHRFTYGFGYSPSTGHYKILRIAKKEVKSGAEIYTVGVDNSWRILGDAPYPYRTPSREKYIGANVAGALHWIVDGDTRGNVCVCAFDIGAEKFQAVPMPPDLRGFEKMSLGVLGDCLCITDNKGRYHFDIWQMKEYANAESWTNDRITMSHIWPRWPVDNVGYFPITIWREREILMVLRYYGSLMSYDPKERKTTEVRFGGEGVPLTEIRRTVALYVPSFCSLKVVMGRQLQMANVKKS